MGKVRDRILNAEYTVEPHHLVHSICAFCKPQLLPLSFFQPFGIGGLRTGMKMEMQV